MATKFPEIVNIDDDDDEIAIIYPTTPFSSDKKGATKSDAISVEDYHPLELKSELKRKFDDDDDDIKLLYSFPKTRKKLLKGECSNSKAEDITKSTFMCEICIDEKPRNEIFRVLGCRHFYCSECMERYVASKLHDNVIKIGCPVSGCKGFLEPQHCVSILPKQVFERWGDVLSEAAILATEKFYCPFKDCSALLVYDKNRKKDDEVIAESECPECNRLFCAGCKVAWHSGIDCKEFQKLNKDERSSEDIMLMNLAKNRRWTRCPKCRIYIEKTMGCSFMMCRCGCGFDYNYGYS